MIKPCSDVTWTSQSQGSSKTKTGIVVCFLRATPYSSPGFNRLRQGNRQTALEAVRSMNLPSKTAQQKDWFLKKLEKVEFASAHDRYLVWVKDANAYYTPQAKRIDQGKK